MHIVQARKIAVLVLQFYIDDVPQTITRAKQPLVEGGASTWGQMRYSFKTTIEINGTTDATKCFVNTWNTSKNLKLRVSKLNSATMSFHRVALLFTDNPVENTDTISSIIDDYSILKHIKLFLFQKWR
jgi:hypothetical protein